MIIAPKEKQVLSGLNSYYLNIKKLVEHYQGEVGTGGIYLRSAAAKAVIFFDDENILNVYFENKKILLEGKEALKTLNQAKYNFIVDIYELDSDKVYFWAGLPAARPLQQGLDTGSTDFNDLLTKMKSEEVTGFFDVTLNENLGEGLLFFNSGEIIGASFRLADEPVHRADLPYRFFVERIREVGATLNIFTIFLKTAETKLKYDASDPVISGEIIVALSALLNTFEGIVKKEKSHDFNLLLKQKCVEKAERYPFLDPFAAEFVYINGKVTFTGKVGEKKLIMAVVETAFELADDLGNREHLQQRLHYWRKKYGAAFTSLGVRI